MGKFSGYLMVSDLDKTFFADGTNIPARNIEAVKYFMDNGGKFTLATGRGAVAAKQIAANIPQNAPEILFNGAMLYDMKREVIIEQHGVDTPDMVSLMHSIIEKYPDMMLVVFKDDKMYCISERCDERIVEALKNPAVMVNVNDLPLPWFKVLCVEKDSVLRELQPYAESFGYPDLRFVRSTPILLEVVGRDNNKGFGLTNLASRLGIDMKKTVAVGDFFNDEPMFRVAGRVFLPENAADELKHYGTVVCDHMKGALGDVVEILDREITR